MKYLGSDYVDACHELFPLSDISMVMCILGRYLAFQLLSRGFRLSFS